MNKRYLIRRIICNMCQMKTGLLMMSSVMLVWLCAACQGLTEPGRTAPSDGDTPSSAVVHVEGLTIRPKRITQTFSTSVLIEAARQTVIKSEVSGKVTSLAFELGAQVRKGQVLCTLDNRRAKIALEQAQAVETRARAAFTLADDNLKRDRALFKKGDITRSRLDESIFRQESAKAELAAARASVEASRKGLEDTKITAPFEGNIQARYVELGDLVGPGTPVAMLTALGSPTGKAFVPPDVATVLAPEAHCTITLLEKTSSGASCEAQVTAIGTVLSSRSGTVPVKVTPLENCRGLGLMPGMSAEIAFVLGSREGVIAIPTDALIDRFGSPAVWKIVENQLVMQPLQMGAFSGGSVTVTKGLEPGDVIVAMGGEKLKAGTKVEWKEAH